MKWVKARCWDDKTVKLTILFIVAALLVAAFTFRQYQRRNFALSASSQRKYNQEMRSERDRIHVMKNKLHILSKFDAGTPLDDDFERHVGESGIDSIQHEANLVINCTKQYVFDDYQRR